MSSTSTPKLCSFEIEKYERKFTFGGTREGLYIHLKDTADNTATGEVAPLPSRSLESLNDAHKNLNDLRDNFLESNFEPLTLHPSVMFGMQMAMHQLQHPKQIINPPLTKLLVTPPLFPPKGPIKLKLALYPLEEAIAFFKKCDGGSKTIRIDLERKWDLATTLEFCKRVDTSSILYIEDPVSNYTDLETFYEKTSIPFAVDQFLLFQPPERIKVLKGLHSIVIKPSLVGGLQECSKLKDLFAPIPVSFSSLFETEVGIEHVKLISYLLCPDTPVGVDTLKFLKRP